MYGKWYNIRLNFAHVSLQLLIFLNSCFDNVLILQNVVHPSVYNSIKLRNEILYHLQINNIDKYSQNCVVLFMAFSSIWFYFKCIIFCMYLQKLILATIFFKILCLHKQWDSIIDTFCINPDKRQVWSTNTKSTIEKRWTFNLKSTFEV